MRLISLAPNCTEILFELGLGNDLVGVTRFCDYPEEAKQIKKVGGWLDSNFKEIMNLKLSLLI